MTTQIAVLPPRFRESAFRRYETHIAQVLHAYPSLVRFDPPKMIPALSCVTFSQRFRDALTSYEQYRWTTMLFTPEKFLSPWKQHIRIFERDSVVFVGPPGAKPPLVGLGEVQIEDQYIYRLPKWDGEIIAAYCLLKSRGILPGFLIKVKVPDSNFPSLNTLKETYDIDWVKGEDGYYTIL